MMFPQSPTPRVFHLPLGCNFPKTIARGLEQRLHGHDPMSWAKTTLIFNTRRSEQRVTEFLASGPARLLPRIKLLSGLNDTPETRAIPQPVSRIRRHLELAQLIDALLTASPELAPRSALFDLADSLARLIDEIQSEAVDPEAIRNIDVSDHSAHWQRTQQFLTIAQQYLAETSLPDKETRQGMVVDALIGTWLKNPPEHPIILAGSTGSRGTTARLMRAIASLPQGAVILPGFDTSMTTRDWANLSSDKHKAEDHPQYRLKAFMDEVDVSPDQVQPWDETVSAEPSKRTQLISLALRPAPITDQWLSEGPKLGDLEECCEDITLLNAPSPRLEAQAISIGIRDAIEQGKTVALISPDRTLTRRVSAALDRWRIRADDSAGIPLHLTAPGRLLDQTARLMGEPVTADTLLALLKNPLVFSGGNRGNHLRWTRNLEIYIRKYGMPFPTEELLMAWANGEKDEGVGTWASLIGRAVSVLSAVSTQPLPHLIKVHLKYAELLSTGDSSQGDGALWLRDAGEKALQTVTLLQQDAIYGNDLSPRDYKALFHRILANEEVRDREQPRPDVFIWGTLEARVGGADIVILAGLNEGSWPEAAAHDPWLNRKMRNEVGLLSPDRKLGLSAHDFQIAAAGPIIWLSRSARSSDAETVPSRWLNRITNLVQGLPKQNGEAAHKEMLARGDKWLQLAIELEKPQQKVEPAKRPAPRPPVSARPRHLSVTRFKHLIRDPYNVYARDILKLKPLHSLRRSADALLRGTIVHSVFEEFIKKNGIQTPDPVDTLLNIAEEVLAKKAPWPTAQRLWLGQLSRIAHEFVEQEKVRQQYGTPTLLEQKGKLTLADISFDLTAQADRIDMTETGSAIIYDYKTGTPPQKKPQLLFDRQLLLQMLMIEEGAFSELGPVPADSGVFLKVGSSLQSTPAPIDETSITEIKTELRALILAYDNPDQGYLARRQTEKDTYANEYDHLSRFGEWDVTDEPNPEVLK